MARKIELTQNKHTLVDDEDYEKLNQLKWYIIKGKYTCYAGKMDRGKTIRMHRIIMNPPPHLCVDHINGNGLDNRRENLRICNKFQNGGNSKISKNNKANIKGVCFHKPSKKWRAQIGINGKAKFLGLFSDKLEAKNAYTKEAKQYFGEFYSDGIERKVNA